LLDIQPQQGAAATSAAPWQLKDLAMEIQAEAIAPPAPIVFDAASSQPADSQNTH